MHDLVDIHDVRELIIALRTVYTSQFNKQFPSEGHSAIPLNALENIALRTLVGINKKQYGNALARLYTSGGKFMPSLAEFRTWCVGESWMLAEEAWSRACQFTVNRTVKITQITKYALDEVQYLIDLGKMRPAQDNFVSTYNVMVNQAQIKGRVQEWYIPPKSLKEPEHVPLTKSQVQQKLAEFMKNSNYKDRVVHVPQKLKSKDKSLNTPVLNEWPDPFDQRESYLSQCELDGHKVPNSIRRQFGDGV